MEQNRRTIFEEKMRRNKGPVTLFDIPFIVFGGKFDFDDGTSLELPNAFERAFIADHLRAAREKCGYCPATR